MAKKAKNSSRVKRARSDVVSKLVDIDATVAAGRTGLLDLSLSSMLDANNSALAEDPESCHLLVQSAEQALAEFICLPLPALAPRFLFQSEGVPLTRFFLISGQEEACKSAFTFEFGRWHRLAGGNLFIIECEVKDSTSLCDSLFNYDREGWKKMKAHSQEEWNEAFFKTCGLVKKVMDGYEAEVKNAKGEMRKKKVPGQGRVAPVMLVVDSISAVMIERFIDQMHEDGAPSMNHPLQAKLLSDFFKVGPKELDGFPMTFAAVSHVKMSNDPRMPYIQIRNTTGGKAPKFQMTCEVDMRRTSKGQYTRPHPKYGELYSIDLHMQTLKNSFGSHAAIEVEMTWYFDVDDRDSRGKAIQKTYFDWNTASIELLANCSRGGYNRKKSDAPAEPGNPEKGKGVVFSAARARRLVEVVDIHATDKRYCWSSALGIPESSPVPHVIAGAILEDKIRSDAAFRLALYEVLGIQQRFLFQPGVDYRQQVAQHLSIQQHESSLRRVPAGSALPLFAIPADDANQVDTTVPAPTQPVKSIATPSPSIFSTCSGQQPQAFEARPEPTPPSS